MDTALHDMHVHLGFMANAAEVAAQARAAGSLLFANTVTPDEWLIARDAFAAFDNVRTGFGMHPWWVGARQGCEYTTEYIINLLDEHNPQFLGEIGLDLGKRYGDTRSEQLDAFRAIVAWAAARGGKLLSLHSVHAASDALDILMASGALDSCTIIFHWFTGPSDQLKRAIDAGCYFSVGPRMIATGKGREYAKAIPARRLLLETDAPPERGMPYSFAELSGGLAKVARELGEIKGPEACGIIAQTAERLLG